MGEILCLYTGLWPLKKGSDARLPDISELLGKAVVFPGAAILYIKVEQAGRKDARASQEAYLMPPQTSFYKNINLWRPQAVTWFF